MFLIIAQLRYRVRGGKPRGRASRNKAMLQRPALGRGDGKGEPVISCLIPNVLAKNEDKDVV